MCVPNADVNCVSFKKLCEWPKRCVATGQRRGGRSIESTITVTRNGRSIPPYLLSQASYKQGEGVARTYGWW